MEFKKIYKHWHYLMIAISIILFLLGDYKENITGNFTIENIGAFVATKNLLLQDSYRIIVTQFLHINIFHLIVNVATLIYFNNILSKLQSPIYNLLIYCFGIIGVAIALYYFSIAGITYVGNSGAISALLGAILVITLTRGKKQLKFEIIEMTVVFIILGFIIPNVSQLMHLSGFISGIVAQIIVLLFIKQTKQNTLEDRL